ncbi:MAG: glycosyltransferase [Bacteroidota bacterium]
MRDNHPLHLSVVIPVRNEAHNILSLLEDLALQDYPLTEFEVIIVDDFSSDTTLQVIEKYSKKTPLDLTIKTLLNASKTGKKHALTHGIECAKYEVILTTDADCRVGKSWIRSFAMAFSPATNIVAGPVSLKGEGLFADLQKVEFAGLVGFGAASLVSNSPSMCSGANLAFRKQAFFSVGGYESNIHIPTGDDEFLLYEILNKYPGSGHFLKEKTAIVTTQCHRSFRLFFNQRARWIGKWKHNKNTKLRMLAVLFFLDYTILLGSAIFATASPSHFNALAGIIFLRMVSEIIFLSSVCKFLKVNDVLRTALYLQLFYPVHVFFMGLLSIFDRYTWKGRRY